MSETNWTQVTNQLIADVALDLSGRNIYVEPDILREIVLTTLEVIEEDL